MASPFTRLDQGSRARCAALEARAHPPINPKTAAGLWSVLAWHPSETTGLLCLAALGYTGTAEVRARAHAVHLSPESTAVHAVTSQRALAHNHIAAALSATDSLAEAERAVAAFGRESEIALERRRRRHAAGASSTPAAGDGELARLEAVAAIARARGVRFLTMRRVAEQLELTHGGLAALRQRLDAEAHPAYLGPALDTARIRPAAAWPSTAGANLP